MNKNIHFFSEKEFVNKETVLERIGVRGRLAMELAALKLPILPGFVIDADVASDLEDVSLVPHLKKSLAKLETIRGRNFGDSENPMLVKIVISPSTVIASAPRIMMAAWIVSV